MTHFTMTMPELEAALGAALHLSRTSSTESKEYRRARRIAEEVQAEISMRCAHQVCAA
jgi:hypothetical protein